MGRERTVENGKIEEYVYRSKLPDIYIPNHLPLHDYVFQNLDAVRHKPCIIDTDTADHTVYSYGDVHQTARRVAAGMKKLGVFPRDVVMLLLPNSAEFVLAFLATSFCGATVTMGNPFCTAEQIRRQVHDCKARLAVTLSANAEKLSELRAKDGVKIVCVDGNNVPEGCLEFSVLIPRDDKELTEDDDGVSPEDVVTLLYSSGTMGRPKGVMVTHRGLVTNIAQHVDGENPNVHLKKEDVLLCVLPLFHIYALTSVLLGGMRRGATVVLMKKFEIGAMMALVERHRVTIAPLVPPIVLALVRSHDVQRYDLSTVRRVVSGAAPMGKKLEDALHATIPTAVFGQVGSLFFPGAGMPLSSYFNDTAFTARTIDDGGWLHTGDLGYVDDDDELFIVDRLKELIKYTGFQVPPAELETLLITHPDIADAADAAVVPLKDEVAGEIPVAFVVKSNGSDITEGDVKSFVAKQVVFYKKIHRAFFLPSIPKSPSGKILRKELRSKL